MGLKVIIVDDQPVFRMLLRDMMGSRVEIVAEAATFDEALSAAERHRPTGMVIDVNVGACNGFQLATVLQQYVPSVKIVMTSANAERVYADLANRIPSATFIEKARLSADVLLAFFQSPPDGVRADIT